MSSNNDVSYRIRKMRKQAYNGMEYAVQEIVFSVPLGVDAAYTLNGWWVLNHVLPDMTDFYLNEDLETRRELYFEKVDTDVDHEIQLFEDVIEYIENNYISKLKLSADLKINIFGHIGCYPNGAYIESSNFLFCITSNVHNMELMYQLNKEFNLPENKIILDELKSWLCDVLDIHDCNEFRFRPLAYYY